jgi:hypothetical protein
MAGLSNLLTGETSRLATSVGTWSKIGTAPHTFTYTREKIKFDSLGSLKITAASSADARFETGQFPSGDQIGWNARAFCWVYSTDPVNATLAVHVYTPAVSSASATTAVPAAKWTLVPVDGFAPTDGGAVSMGISVSGVTVSDLIYVTNPVIVTPDAISRNIFSAEAWSRLPEYLKEADEVQVNPDFPLLRFIDAAMVDASDVFAIWNSAFYIPPEQGGALQVPSTFEPEYASIETVRWLARILGVQFYDPSSGTTPWINFTRGLDPDGITEWLDWMTGLDLAPTDGTITWSEIQNYNAEVTGLLDLLRWQVRTAYFGLRAGTKEAVLACVKKVLTGTQYALFIPLVGGDPWKFKVQTKQSETPENPTIGTASATVTAIVANAVPAGFEFVHETVAG